MYLNVLYFIVLTFFCHKWSHVYPINFNVMLLIFNDEYSSGKWWKKGKEKESIFSKCYCWESREIEDDLDTYTIKGRCWK